MLLVASCTLVSVNVYVVVIFGRGEIKYRTFFETSNGFDSMLSVTTADSLLKYTGSKYFKPSEITKLKVPFGSKTLTFIVAVTENP